MDGWVLFVQYKNANANVLNSPPHGCLVSAAPTVWDPLYEQLSPHQRSLLSVVYKLGVGDLPTCYTLFWYCGQRWVSSTEYCTLSLSPFLLAFLPLCIK